MNTEVQAPALQLGRAVQNGQPPARVPLAWTALTLLSGAVFRIRARGLEHLPRSGGAVLLANHLSRVDLLFVSSACRRQVRFTGIRDSLFHRWAPWAGSSVDGWRSLCERGELVCVFAESELSRIGQTLPFGKQAEAALGDLGVPVIPVALEGVGLGAVWRGGAPARLASARGFWRQTVTVSFGTPLPARATVNDAFSVVQELATDAWMERKVEMTPLHRAFVRTARRHPRRFAMADQRTARLNFLSALARTIYLGRRLAPVWGKGTHVGILLPPSIAGALVNFAALLAGKIPVNLNYTASNETVTACLSQCGITQVIAAKTFLDKIPLKLSAPVVLLEELAAAPRAAERMTALLLAALAPVRLIERTLGRRAKPSMDEAATVIFSSGSTGQPKGVVLTHFNIAANIAQMDRVFGLTARDRLLGTLPFFHSFGFTGTLCLSGTMGAGVAYHPTPLDPAAVSRLVRDYTITFLLSTPTFLQLYARGCSPQDFGSLRVVMAGAEKLHERLANLFEEKFGIRPLEGYGCTECAPVVAVNTHEYRGPGVRQVGAKLGTIGRPLPGISVRIVDPDTNEPLPRGAAGLLLARGPNVMQGYLNDPHKTADVLQNGWYHTGDIAALDDDGFIRITDRLSRFSKIGGQMVPHIKIEERLHELVKAIELTFVVAGVPDPKKGERLVVLHRLAEAHLKVCLEQLALDSMPNLWKPKCEDFIHVETFPMLGTGKLDLRGIREVAAIFVAKRE
jgi:acyl-[acyl-carrier-protein]-phospholipid O-acyltransferase/long-chain-fatty-acid--[acyl-carrier-protein] ligase